MIDKQLTIILERQLERQERTFRSLLERERLETFQKLLERERSERSFQNFWKDYYLGFQNVSNRRAEKIVFFLQRFPEKQIKFFSKEKIGVLKYERSECFNLAIFRVRNGFYLVFCRNRDWNGVFLMFLTFFSSRFQWEK